MRKILLTSMLAILSISSCGKSNTKFTSESTTKSEQKIERDYNEIKHLKVSWESLFFLANPEYFVYFYSRTCSHCNELKNIIIDYGLTHQNFYFCEADEKHIIKENTDGTIGSIDIKDFWISGYPSLCKFESNKCVINVAGNTSIYIVLNL